MQVTALGFGSALYRIKISAESSDQRKRAEAVFFRWILPGDLESSNGGQDEDLRLYCAYLFSRRVDRGLGTFLTGRFWLLPTWSWSVPGKKAVMNKEPVVLEKTWGRHLGVHRSGGMYRIAHWQLAHHLQELQRSAEEEDSGLVSHVQRVRPREQ